MKKVIVLFTVVFALISCNSDSIFSEYHGFSDIVWSKETKPEFTFNVEQEMLSNIDLELRVAHGYPYKFFRMDMAISNDAGFEKSLPIEVQVRGDNNYYLGEQMGDIIDIKSTMMENFQLEKGKYTITFDQTTQEGSLAFVMEVGVSVNKVVTEKK